MISMKKTTNNRFWLIEWYHFRGYSAPQYHVETTIHNVDLAKKEAIRLAKQLSRFTDFPKSWYFKITLLPQDEEKVS